MSGIQRKIVVFAIALTFWGNADANTTTPNQHESNQTLPCSVREPEYKKAADAAYKAFDVLVNITVYYSNMNNTPYMTQFTQSLDQFLEKSFTYCRPDAKITTENFKDYLKAVQFTLSNVTVLKELQKDGAFKCILEQKASLNQCVDKVNGKITLHNNYSRLHAKSHLNFNNLACVETKKVKPCVMKVIEDNCVKAKEYVENIFDFVISKNCNTTQIETNASVKITGHWSFFILVSFWSALALYKS